MSAHFVYRSDPTDSSVCGAVVEVLEHRFSTLRSQLPFPWPEGARLTYTKYPDQSSFLEHARCSSGNSSCFRAEFGIQSSDGLNSHELVHALLSYLGDSHPLLEEGAAEALSCEGGWPRPVRPLSLDEITARGVWQGRSSLRSDAYRASGRFVARLLRNHESAKFLEFYQHASPDALLPALRLQFGRIYGESLDNVWNAALHDSSPEAGCVRWFECSAPDVNASLPSRWGDSCSQDDRVRTVSVSQTQWVALGSDTQSVHLGACPDGGFQPTVDFWDPMSGGDRGEWFVVELPKERFYLSHHGKKGGEVSFETLANTTAPAIAAPNPGPCPLLSTKRVRQNVTFSVSGLPGPAPLNATRMFRWYQEGLSRRISYRVACSSQARVSLCVGCGGEECQPICTQGRAHSTTPLSWGSADEPLVFRVEGQASSWFRLNRAFGATSQ